MKVFKDFDLTAYNAYRLSARCRMAYFPESDEDIRTLFRDQHKEKVLLGGGYNVILSQDYYESDFVIFSGNYNAISLVENDCMLCEAGADTKSLSEFALTHSLSGLEIYYDIPSSLGGAVVMNAGAGGEDIKGLLERVWYYNPTADAIETASVDEVGFVYRNSLFQQNPELIVCRALLRLKPSKADDILNKMDRTRDTRWAKQPRDYPNAGSVFKRPPGRYVGPMLDELGLKGYQVGGAKVSEKHSGFIVNCDGACGADILTLISEIQASVKTRFGVDLEVEQRII